MKKANLLLILIVFQISLLLNSTLLAQNASSTGLDTAKILMIEGKNKASLTVLDSILKNDSTNAIAYYYKGLCYQGLSNFQKASEALSKALIYKSDDINFMVTFGNDLFSCGRFSQAEDILFKAFLLDSLNTKTCLSLGKIYMQEQKWRKALKIYNILFRQDSVNSFIYEQAAKCNFSIGDTNEAVIDYQVAHKLNKFNINTIMGLSYLYYLQDKLISAIRIVNDGLAVYPASTEIWTRKGDIYLKMQEYPEAINCYGNSIRFGDSSSNNYRNLGICYYWTDAFDSAVTSLKAAININDRDPSAYFYLGASYKSLNDYEKAVKNLLAAANLLKNDFLSEIYTQLGASYNNAGKYGNAIKFYKDALRENPGKEEVNFYLAAVYEHYYKDKSGALNYYRKFLKDSVTVDKKLVNYAEVRVKALIETSFMNTKH